MLNDNECDKSKYSKPKFNIFISTLFFYNETRTWMKSNGDQFPFVEKVKKQW